MKRVVQIVLMLELMIVVHSCTQENSVKVDESSNSSRVKLKEVRVINGHAYSIVTLDDTLEFLVVDGSSPVKISK